MRQLYSSRPLIGSVRIFFLLVYLMICFQLIQPAFSQAGTILAASPSQVDIQAAINASVDGDLVIIPSGSGMFLQQVVVDKAITLKGAGAGLTKISKTGGQSAFRIYGKDGKRFRVTGFTFDGNGSSNGIYISGDSKEFRIDNNVFTRSYSRAIEIEGYTYGVIDKNIFTDNSVTDIVVYGDDTNAWSRPVVLGSTSAVYIENNVFTHRNISESMHSVASNHGARYVFRYNEINDFGALNTAPIDAHGNYYYGRGTVSYEIYGNSINSEHSYRGMYLRGGTGVVYNNQFSGDFTLPINLANYRSFMTDSSTSCGYSACDYPAIDQINNLYLWNNTVNGSLVSPSVLNRGLERTHIQQARDYYTTQASGYNPLAYPHPLTTDATKPKAPLGLKAE